MIVLFLRCAAHARPGWLGFSTCRQCVHAPWWPSHCCCGVCFEAANSQRCTAGGQKAVLSANLPPHHPFSLPARSGMVAMIMMRTLHRDISKYNQLETAEEAQEETGWKLVRARPTGRQSRRIVWGGLLIAACCIHWAGVGGCQRRVSRGWDAQQCGAAGLQPVKTWPHPAPFPPGARRCVPAAGARQLAGGAGGHRHAALLHVSAFWVVGAGRRAGGRADGASMHCERRGAFPCQVHLAAWDAHATPPHPATPAGPW